jgi:hypothetical protein
MSYHLYPTCTGPGSVGTMLRAENCFGESVIFGTVACVGLIVPGIIFVMRRIRCGVYPFAQHKDPPFRSAQSAQSAKGPLEKSRNTYPEWPLGGSHHFSPFSIPEGCPRLARRFNAGIAPI